jgi:hypothetical protein
LKTRSQTPASIPSFSEHTQIVTSGRPCVCIEPPCALGRCADGLTKTLSTTISRCLLQTVP